MDFEKVLNSVVLVAKNVEFFDLIAVINPISLHESKASLHTGECFVDHVRWKRQGFSHLY